MTGSAGNTPLGGSTPAGGGVPSVSGTGSGGTSSSGGVPAAGAAACSATSSGGGWSCPSGPFTASALPGATATAERVVSVPLADTFNNTGNDFTNVEGPVWIGGSLYFSEFKGNGVAPPSRISKLSGDGSVVELIADSGSNGLATDGTNIFSANHGAHGIVRFSLPDKTPTTLVSTANGKALNSPNDLTIAKNGTIYFTDPTYQNFANPQGATNVYQYVSGQAEATVITDYTMQPNGVTLSLDGQTLIVGGMSGVKKYAITAGEVAMMGTPFGPGEITNPGVNTDGMTLDCAGNLYVVVAGGTTVYVIQPDGTTLGTISVSSTNVTNVAFGGTDHQTLYITGQGAGKNQGLFQIHLNVPGLPY